ncbi:DNA-binding response OmpR family regulator [Streptomyces sp. SAI-208]|jgi:DNA-binding response OmpR family regulator|uniref:response regulator transcription factor n=1 Tax=unclassified Streptomyces TaxID=2593676 RepID=UPI0024736E4C|nr:MULTISPECIES: response regulator transcription factor [unclassified Streptomyces]MDH6521182.1 DNA-binding response OmpR family regulator [Streptomyces sp. SAI-090]MDH6553403.1 DNA-binding response OmpR family regulator [Streptomyces sp. SAI-041]MDH6572485.1 DNA-binding response OmpR family regulator [Streptomyces sp. SAI-117]MDH6582556.1 DNA-binding response OmpR family regulator [Streptomyces sp. SAI-133]MDH6612180.1 DNA-binding response OmpR family regulator [Streptomyces sp. SAI-208]
MRPHLALIEDEPDFALMCRSYLERAGFTVTWAMDARAGKSVLYESRVDLAILDLGLPDGSGLELLRALRSTSRLPVIVVSGRGAEADRVAGLEIGADDYLVKPFSQRELVARIHAVLRRSQPPEPPSVIQAGSLLVDTAARQVSVDGVPLTLRPKEFALLEMLAAAPGRVFSAAQLLERIWGASWQQPATVIEHVYRLRGKLAELPAPAPRITTVRGYGYRLDP